jgi:hypothetical protein
MEALEASRVSAVSWAAIPAMGSAAAAPAVSARASCASQQPNGSRIPAGIDKEFDACLWCG